MWSIREDFVAIFVGQAPMVYPMFKKNFWNGYSSTSTDNEPSRETHEMRSGMSGSAKPKDPYSLTQIGVTRIDPTESQENIIKEGDSSSDEARSQKQQAQRKDMDKGARYSEGSSSVPAPADGQSGAVRVDQTFQLETSSNHFDPVGSQPVVTPWHDSRGVNDGRAF